MSAERESVEAWRLRVLLGVLQVALLVAAVVWAVLA